ncbi:MAG: DEAD/DEAH box helicase family protein, partial [Firmicutes bacterium]|nr:DEAD/DEAH box helicase family protein [Bacillota bacterium]
MTIYDLLEDYRRTSFTTRDQGTQFERLIQAFLQTDPLYREKFSRVWLWPDWPGRQHRPDTGIDLVAEQADTEDLWAIQCKFWDHRVTKEDLDSFFTASGKRPFTQRLIVATAELSQHAQEAFEDQWTHVHTLTLDDLDRSAIDWSAVSWRDPARLHRRQPKTPRPHQERAIAAVLEGFQTTDRGQLIMACGTGKTLTGLHIAEALVPPEGGTVLVLTPSIALVSQTLREWTAEAHRTLHAYAVCSDTHVGQHDEDLRPSDLAFPATTDPERLSTAIHRSRTQEALTVIFSTYQSIAVISQAQHDYGLPAFDVVISDEAHRTVGSSQKTAKGTTQSYFTMVHDDQFVQAQKRLYMTATPRIYAETSKRKAADSSVVLYSMDDETIFGPEFHRLPFSAAVEADILSDYKVIILTVDEAEAFALFGEDIHDEKKLEAKLTDEAKIIGCLRAFAKRFPKEDDDDIDNTPMQRVVAFTNSINDSQRVMHLLNQATPHLAPNPGDLLPATARHVDGSMNVANRNAALSWLKGRAEDGTCRVLSNARCLTEGVDVPSLDAVVFLQPRDSQVDVVQAVGRVMRKAPGKQFGYVVLPVVLPADMQPEDLLEDRKEYRVVWQVLNALRSHDDHFNDLINHLEFNQKSHKVRIIGKSSPKPDQMQFQWPPQELQRVFYAKLVKKVGDREYWDEWARKVAHIADRYRIHITDILARSDPKAYAAQTAFARFLSELQENVNDSVSRDEALDMLAQHLVTQPVFDALFADYAFTQHNPVSQSMEQVLAVFNAHALWKEKESVTQLEGKVLDQLHGEISRQAGGIETAAGKQRFLIKIYDKFFRIALKKTAERLGIVYTPIAMVDFILHSVESVLEDEFGQRLTDENVHILDPFTGTGTFLVRLMLSGLIRPEDVVRKYRHELHANEIVLLAYYLAAINIEQTFHAVSGQDYEPFPGIVLTDTFQQGESRNDFMGYEMFPENNDRLARQNQTEIRVIVGNPPYSVGQDNANDNNQNIKYPVLDDRIRDTYAAHSTAVNKNSLYDSYIRA